MKVSLVSPPSLQNYGSLNIGKDFIFPMGLGYIASSLEKSGHEVEIFEPGIYHLTQREIYDHFKEFKPDLAGFTCRTPTVHSAVAIAHIAKSATECKTIVGGVHPSALPVVTLKQFPDFDFLCYGEGDYIIGELLQELSSARHNYGNILGLVYRQGNDIIKNGMRPMISDMDRIPYPARHLTDLKKYKANSAFYKDTLYATLNTSRGCPANCSFCVSYCSLGYKFRPHSPDYVLGELEQLVAKDRIRNFQFVDDTFTFSKERAIAICEGMLNRGYKIKWYSYARVDTVDRELLSIMRKAGCYAVLYGIETGNNEIMKSIGKGITFDQAIKAIEISNSLGIKTFCSFMFGHKGDTVRTMRETLDFAARLRCAIASFDIMIPFPGTKAYEELSKTGHPLDWNNFLKEAPFIHQAAVGLNRNKLKRFQTYAYWYFYGRPSQIIRIIRQISSIKELFHYLRGLMGMIIRVFRLS